MADGDLQKWRLKSTFDVPALCNHLYTEEVVEFKKQVWDTLAKDPLFSEPDGELSLVQKRELALKRLRRLVEYEFVTDDDLLQCPMKSPAFNSTILPFDTATIISLQLSAEV
jgi:acyl-CoA oxidase